MTDSAHYIIIAKYIAWERIDRSEYIDHNYADWNGPIASSMVIFARRVHDYRKSAMPQLL